MKQARITTTKSAPESPRAKSALSKTCKKRILTALLVIIGFALPAQAMAEADDLPKGFAPPSAITELKPLRIIRSYSRKNRVSLNVEAAIGTGYWLQKSNPVSATITLEYDREIHDIWNIMAKVGCRADGSYLALESGAFANAIPYERIEEQGQQVVSENGIVMTMYPAKPDEEEDPDATKTGYLAFGGSLLANIPLKSELNWNLTIRGNISTDFTFERTRTLFVLLTLSPGLTFTIPKPGAQTPLASFLLGLSLNFGFRF